MRHCGLGAESGLMISMLKKLNWLCLTGNTGAFDVKMDGSVLEEKSSFKMLGLTFSSNLAGLGLLHLFLKLPPKKTGALIHSTKFLSPEVALPYTHPWNPVVMSGRAGAPNFGIYLEFLDKLQNRYPICWTVVPSLATSLLKPAHRWNVASLSLFCRYYCGRCSSELAQLFPLPFSRRRSTCYSDRLHDFCVTIIPR